MFIEKNMLGIFIDYLLIYYNIITDKIYLNNYVSFEYLLNVFFLMLFFFIIITINIHYFKSFEKI